MICEQFDRRLQDVLDSHGSVEHDERLAQHAAGCDACRELLDSYACLLDALAESRVPAPSVDFADMVCNRLRPETPADRSRRSGWLMAMAALAAAALLIALPLAKRSTAPSLAMVATAPESEPPVLAAPSSPEPLPPSPATAAPTHVPSQRAIVDEAGNMLARLREELAPLETVNPIAVSLRPIATSLESAIIALRNSLPLIRNDDHPKPQASLSSMRLIG